MNCGLALILLTGALWATLGVLMSRRATRGGSPTGFFSLAYSLCALGGWLLTVRYQSIASTPDPGSLVGILILVGIGSGCYLLCFSQALRHGPHGPSWAIAQSGLIAPFLVAVVIWGDRPGPTAWAGLVLILVALPLTGRAGGRVASPGWLLWSLAALCCVGLQQSLSGLPSRWGPTPDPANLRPAVAFSATAITHLVWALRAGVRWSRGDLIDAAIFAFFALGSFFTLFLALDQLTATGEAATAFPFAVGTSIALFLLWRGLRGERLPRSAWLAVATIIAGVFLLGLG